ncbi:hypothetical protein BK004_02295 [bacterium CG10_46_32]|nr:MAG: hypothetical protein BK004_02295 [bacterium CG10_46_32]PIR56144.1 MAG: hypothetical protein COU73_02315 [Parcubacteria group bacterium CG10_big_fil_rev_8_21_14_0_10_46_32]
MRVARDPQFIREFTALPKTMQERATQKLALFLENPRHPSLRVKKMEGRGNVWEARITRDYRFTFEIIGDLCKLRRIGTHDILKRP